MTPHAEARPHTARSQRSCLNDEPVKTARTWTRTRCPDPDVERRRSAGAADDRRRSDPPFPPAGPLAIRRGAARRAGGVNPAPRRPASVAREATRRRLRADRGRATLAGGGGYRPRDKPGGGTP